jgi:hypothetical protein
MAWSKYPLSALDAAAFERNRSIYAEGLRRRQPLEFAFTQFEIIRFKITREGRLKIFLLDLLASPFRFAASGIKIRATASDLSHDMSRVRISL